MTNHALDSSLPEPGEIAKALVNALPQNILDSLSFLFTMAKVASIVFLIYLIILIIQALVRIKQAFRMKDIARNVSEINQKLDRALHLKKEKDEIGGSYLSDKKNKKSKSP